MANKNGVVGIGLNIDYEKALKQMVSGFNQALTQISNEAKKIEYTGDVKEQIKGIKGEIKGFSDEFRAELKKINDQQIDGDSFKKFESEVTKRFEKIETKFANINTKIKDLKEQLGLLEGSDTASKMKAQFDDWRQSIVNTYQELSKVIDLVETNKMQETTGVNVKDIQEQLKIYRATLREIQKARTEKNKLSNVNDNLEIDETDKIQKELKEIAKTSGIKKISDDLDEAQGKIKQLFKDIKTQTQSLGDLDTNSVDYTKAISQIVKLQAEAVKTAKAIENMDLFLGKYSESYGGLKNSTYNYIDKIYGDLDAKEDTSSFLYQIGEYISQAEKFIEQNKNVKDSVETVTTAVNGFTIKNGAIQIPIEVAKDKEVLSEITKAITSMQSYVDKHPVVAQVKLVLDGQSTKAYKTKGDIAKQLEDGQDKPAVDISKSIKKTYIQSVREAEKAANQAINKIKSVFDSSPIKISIDDKAFTEELSTMVNSSLGKIANDATGLNVNSELEKLIGNLKEVSTSLSGNENFKLGLDEASIERITAAIKDMADMIQRAFGVASNDDISAQWTAIESKFKNVAGEEGKLLKNNKDHKVAIEELAVEYKKYLDMGGKNDLSELTTHKQTIKNIATEYENLGKTVQEAVQQQEKANKKPAPKKVSSEEAEAIKGTTRENKKLETQAGKTSTALDNEGKSAQSAAKKFKKLAEEKNAAVVANKELAKAAKETANALEKESKAKKNETKTSKKDTSQTSEQSELLSKYKEIYEVIKKISNLDIKIARLDETKNSNQMQELVSQYEAYTKVIGEFFDDPNVGKLSMGLLEELNDIYQISQKQVDEIIAKAKDAQENLKRGFGYKAQDAFNKFELKYQGNSNWSQVADDVERLRQSVAGIDSKDKLNEFNQNLSDIIANLNNISKDNKLGKIIDREKTFTDINDVRANIDSLFASMGKVNEKSIRITGTDKLTAEVKSANGEIRKIAVSLDSKDFARFVDKGIVEFGRLRAAAEGVFKGIKDMVRIYLSPQDFIRYFRQGFDAVKEIDTAMTELKKVSDAPIGDIVAYFDDATESAKALGSTVKDMISATADWSRLGYNLPDSRELGEVAVLYKNVGDGIDINTANESLVSTIQGFQLQAKDAMSVIDSFNEVSNNYAISSAGIGEALKRSAAAFNAANTDLNQSIALITAGNEIVQSPEKVGTMWQTVSARIRGTKTELEQLGEATDDVLSTSKLQSLVMGYTDVNIMQDKNTYKDIYTIVSEIGKKWKELKDVEKAALLEGLAGKKQSNTLAAVLNNAERLEEIYQTAEGSMGSAQREQDRYAQSIQYSLDQLTAHGEEFWNTFINKDDVKDFIDIINTLISGATKLVDIVGSIPTVAGILGGFASLKNVGINMLVAYLSNLYCFELPTI